MMHDVILTALNKKIFSLMLDIEIKMLSHHINFSKNGYYLINRGCILVNISLIKNIIDSFINLLPFKFCYSDLFFCWN